MAKKSTAQGKLTAAQRAKLAADAKKVIARNKKARHEYHIDKTYEAGLVLSGTEVKALRLGRASLTEAWIEFDRRGEAWLVGCNIPIYAMGSWTNHAPTQKRKLLLHQHEINNLQTKVREKGTTVVPLELYFIRGRAKVEIALARGKKEWDKRQTLRQRQDARDTARALSEARKRQR